MINNRAFLRLKIVNWSLRNNYNEQLYELDICKVYTWSFYPISYKYMHYKTMQLFLKGNC